jgi:outer membrane protein
MMKPAAVIAFAFWIGACAGPALSEVWTLDRTVKAALAASNPAAINRLDSASSTADALSARNALYPTLSVTADANYVSKVMQINIPPRSITFGSKDSYDFALRVNQILYDGGRLRAQKEAGRDRAEMSSRQAEASELASEFQGKTAFFAVVLARENISASEQSIREAENHHADVRALRAAGMAVDDDVLFSKLRISQAEMSRVTYLADMERALASFRKVAGLKPDEEVTVEWNAKSRSDSASGDADSAIRSRPEFKALDASLRAAMRTAESAKAGRLPMLGLGGAFNYGKPGLDQIDNKWMRYFTGGVSMNWSLWDWGAVNREVEKAYIMRKKTERTIADLKLEVARQVSEAAAGFDEAAKRVSLAEESAEYAKRHLEIVNATYKAGTATERDYDTAHALYTKSLYDEAAARVGREISRAQLEYALGIRYRGEQQ